MKEKLVLNALMSFIWSVQSITKFVSVKKIIFCSVWIIWSKKSFLVWIVKLVWCKRIIIGYVCENKNESIIVFNTADKGLKWSVWIVMRVRSRIISHQCLLVWWTNCLSKIASNIMKLNVKRVLMGLCWMSTLWDVLVQITSSRTVIIIPESVSISAWNASRIFYV